MDKIEGVWTASVTPFDKSKQLDLNAWDKNLEFQLAAGINGIVVAGTTGEGPTLTVQEKLTLIRRAKATVGGKIRIMAGTGGSNTDQTVELSRLAEDAGADSLLVVTPPYNKPSLAGLMDHFGQVAARVSIPICLYHVPGRTGQRLEASAIKQLLTIDRIISVKEASADLALFSRVVEGSPNATILSGDDPTFLPSLSIGGQGVVSVISNLLPEPIVALWQAWQKGDTVGAQRIHHRLFRAMEIMFCESNPSPVKAAMARRGLCLNILRSPLAPLSESLLEGVMACIDEAERS